MHLPSHLIKLLTHPLICKQNYSELRSNCGRTFSKRRGGELGRTVLKLIRKWCLFSKSPFPSWNSLLVYSGSEGAAWHPLQMRPDDMLIWMTPRQLSNRASVLNNIWMDERELWRGKGISGWRCHIRSVTLLFVAVASTRILCNAGMQYPWKHHMERGAVCGSEGHCGLPWTCDGRSLRNQKATDSHMSNCMSRCCILRYKVRGKSPRLT